MEKAKILLVDDEPDILEFLSYSLNKEGYEVFLANTGLEGLKMAEKVNPDLIVLDMMMPIYDGVQTCIELRKMEAFKHTLIVFLTAKTDEITELMAYANGADDYITKPIKPKILISKIKALFRRSFPDDLDTNIQVENILINRTTYSITYNNEEFLFPRKEFELLSLLASIPEKVFTREEIMQKVWGNDVIVGERTIDVHIRKLRERLGNNRFSTIKGVGYKMNLLAK